MWTYQFQTVLFALVINKNNIRRNLLASDSDNIIVNNALMPIRKEMTIMCLAFSALYRLDMIMVSFSANS